MLIFKISLIAKCFNIIFQAKHQGPWVTHQTPYGRCIYLNLETLDYSWEKPTFFPTPKYLNMEEIQVSLSSNKFNMLMIIILSYYVSIDYNNEYEKKLSTSKRV